jgi:DNA replication and repair protein RecF
VVAAPLIARLLVRDFRCFGQLEIDFDRHQTFVVGPNAVGKTSLLEAVAILLRLQSPRTHQLAHVVRNGARGFVTDGYVSELHLQFYFSPRRRKLALDAVEQRRADEYLKIGRVVYFGNADIELVRGGAEQRRRFLDFVGAQLFSEYRDVWRAYARALRSRNSFLKAVPIRTRELAAFTQPLLQYGIQLTRLRAQLVERITDPTRQSFAAISDREETTELTYRAGATEDFAAALAASAEEERRFKSTVVGPHRDDLVLLLQGQAADQFGSEGQQRTFAIALKVGQAKLLTGASGQTPILLIDDVFGELDTNRRTRLIAALPQDAQRIVTTTTLDWLNPNPDGKIYRLIDQDGVRRCEAS